MVNSKRSSRGKNADDLAAEQRLKEEKEMSEKLAEEKARMKDREDEGRELKCQAKSQS